MFLFTLNENARLKGTKESGRIIARAEYVNAEPSYLLRYKNAEGNLIESWWTQSAIEVIVDKKRSKKEN